MFNKQFSGSRNLWLIRLYYVLYFGGMGAISPFINLFYISHHLTGTQIGFFSTTSALVGILSAPVWGRLTDTIRRPRLLLQLALTVSSLTYFWISQQTIFLNIAVIIGLNALFSSGINPQSQAQALEAAGEVGAGYGSVRLCGSLGYAIMATVSGWAIQRTSVLTGFYLFVALTFLGAVVLFFIRPSKNKPVEKPTIVKAPKLPMKQVLREMIRNRELLFFMIAMVVVWVASNGTSFESVYLQRLGAKESIIGSINTIGAVIEIPMMLLADRVLRRKGSAFTLLGAFFSYILGLLIVVIHPSVASFFVYRAINGISMGFFSVAFTYFIVERSPAQQTGTMLALYSVTVAGLVSIIMSPISGRVFDLFGPYWLYVFALSGYIIAALIIYLGVMRKPAQALRKAG